MEGDDDGHGGEEHGDGHGHGHKLLWYGSVGGVEPVAAGARLSRRIDLVAGYPVELLDVGPFRVACSLEREGTVHRSPAAALRVVSGPAAVPHLLARLEGQSLSGRYRAAALLHRMTARGFGFDPAAPLAARATAGQAWREWWHAIGTWVRWNGPLYGEAVGAVAPPRAALDPKSRWELLRALERWAEGGRYPDRVGGARFVEEGLVAYPPGEVFFEADEALTRAFAKALVRVAADASRRDEAGAAPAHALCLVRTLARMPQAGLLGPLQDLETSLPRAAPGWEPVSIALGELLDFLDPERVPAYEPAAAGPRAAAGAE